MALSAGTIVDKISELRSKIAVLEGLVLYLEANYKGSDAGEAEMRFTRRDFATVPQAHIDVTIADLSAAMGAFAEELEHWEGLMFPTEDDAPAKKQNGKHKEKSRGAKSRDPSSLPPPDEAEDAES